MAIDPSQNPSGEGGLELIESRKTKRPRRYQVVFHNDDYTTMEFVVHVLIKFFRKNETEATHIMLNIHHKDFGVVDVFPRDIAESKVAQVTEYAKKNQQPLKATAEPEDEE